MSWICGMTMLPLVGDFGSSMVEVYNLQPYFMCPYFSTPKQSQLHLTVICCIFILINVVVGPLLDVCCNLS